MTKREARAWKRRWEAVNKAEREELRKTTAETKLHQLNALVNSARRLGWREGSDREDAEIRDRWNRLRRYYCR
jgi:hypothetical protein